MLKVLSPCSALILDEGVAFTRPLKKWIISKLVDRIFYESLPRARKESQIAPQASAGYGFP
jgi:hypothetical protein